jgi:cholesterol oxidase
MSWDYVIVGSGFGGAVSACRLAAAGMKVLVLERGRRWTPEEFPRDAEDAWVWDQDAPERCNGWIDLRIMDQMWVAQGSGVGGGSLIYANISIDAPETAFNSGWPSAITLKVLRPYYDMAADMLKPARVPENQWTERFKLMRDAAAAIGEEARVRALELAVTFDPEWTYQKENARDPSHSKSWINAQGKTQGTCVHLGLCDIGCPVGAKNTLDLNYLAAAESAGATIQPCSMVSHVSSLGSTWRVHYDHIDAASCTREPAYVDAKRVILAAGSLGSTELLLRCRDEFRTLTRLSSHLGRGWSSNGDFLTPAIYRDRLVNASEGPTITGAIDFLDGSDKGARYFVEDGGFPNLLEHYINKRLGSASMLAAFALRRLKRMQKGALQDHIMPWFGQAIDGADGKLYLGRSWLRPWRRRLKLDWNPDRSVLGIQGMADMHVKLTEASGGKPLPPLAWKYLRTLITPHPLGGCNMAASAAGGVVDDRCRVFGHDGLYVMDGSVIPRPIGLNPSKTIAAVTERAVERLCTAVP